MHEDWLVDILPKCTKDFRFYLDLDKNRKLFESHWNSLTVDDLLATEHKKAYQEENIDDTEEEDIPHKQISSKTIEEQFNAIENLKEKIMWSQWRKQRQCSSSNLQGSRLLPEN